MSSQVTNNKALLKKIATAVEEIKDEILTATKVLALAVIDWCGPRRGQI